MTPRMSAAARLVLAAAMSGLLAPGAMAQGGRGGGGGSGGGPPGGFRMMGGGMGGGMMGQISQSISKESLEQYERMLNLTAEQKQTVQTAFDAYTDRLKTEQDAATEAARQTMQDARDGGGGGGGAAGRGAGREMMASMLELRKHAEQMEASFLNDVKAVLTPEQQVQWPKVERARRREKAASGMMVASGERVDLVKIVDGLHLSAESRAAIDPLLEQYETDLDKELAARTKVNDEVTAATAEAFSKAEGDFAGIREKLQPMQEKVREASAKVQDVNRRYTSKVQSLLPEDKRPAFAKAAKEARFVDVFRPTPQMRAFEAALTFEDLEEAQKSKIKSLQAQYAKDLESLNSRLAAATEKSEAAGGGPMDFRRPDPEMSDLRREKGELGRDVMDKLRAILNPEQQKKLPEIPQGFRGGPGGPNPPGDQGGRGRRGGQGGQGDRGGGGGGGGR